MRTKGGLRQAGHKHAHASLERDFEVERDELPRPGEHVVVLDGLGLPLVIVRTTHVERRDFKEIDDSFAFEAGEGERALAGWLTAHRQRFAEPCGLLGRRFRQPPAQ